MVDVSVAPTDMAPPPPSRRNWGNEADKLDLYVWDYCKRRGYNAAAQALTTDAGLGEVPEVPLKTPQGLLFEYARFFAIAYGTC